MLKNATACDTHIHISCTMHHIYVYGSMCACCVCECANHLSVIPGTYLVTTFTFANVVPNHTCLSPQQNSRKNHILLRLIPTMLRYVLLRQYPTHFLKFDVWFCCPLPHAGPSRPWFRSLWVATPSRRRYGGRSQAPMKNRQKKNHNCGSRLDLRAVLSIVEANGNGRTGSMSITML